MKRLGFLARVGTRGWCAVALFALVAMALTSVGLTRAHREANARLTKVFWLGPAGITGGETQRFSYNNQGTEDVLVSWALSDAVSGQVLVPFRDPIKVPPTTGLLWDTTRDCCINRFGTSACLRWARVPA